MWNEKARTVLAFSTNQGILHKDLFLSTGGGAPWYTQRMKKPTVLIVEDDAMIRKLYADAFELAGLTVLQAENGEEGVALALAEHPDAILMDIMMPVMNGHEAVAKIRRDAWGKSAKIIFLTNMSDAENVVHAVEAGSDEYIIKANASVKEVVNQTRMAMRA